MATLSSIPAPEMRPHSPYRPPGDKSAWSTKTNLERAIWILQTPFRTLLCLSNVTFYLGQDYIGFMKESCIPGYKRSSVTLGIPLDMMVIYEYGDDVRKFCVDERIILICNHQSTADVPVLMTTLQSKGVASRKTLWLMDVMFRWTPFGIIARMHGDYFIRQGKATREKELIRLKDHLRKVFWNRDRRWIILFPEGGFYYNRIQSSQKYGYENGYPHLEHATLPRYGAIKAIMEEVGPKKNYKYTDSITMFENGSKLQFIRDTVGAIREKKYVKGFSTFLQTFCFGNFLKTTRIYLVEKI
ncbi:LGAT1 [Dirofilaria immitis]|nr:LGAT1 [Dirofilaria immitis]